MTKAKKLGLQFNSEFIKLKTLAEASGINFPRLYWRTFKEAENELPLQDRTKIANTLMKDLKTFFGDLGFDVTIKPRG